MSCFRHWSLFAFSWIKIKDVLDFFLKSSGGVGRIGRREKKQEHKLTFQINGYVTDDPSLPGYRDHHIQKPCIVNYYPTFC